MLLMSGSTVITLVSVSPRHFNTDAMTRLTAMWPTFVHSIKSPKWRSSTYLGKRVPEHQLDPTDHGTGGGGTCGSSKSV